MTPLVVEFSVAVSCAHAFDVWANQAALWWPRGHTVSGVDELNIVFEAGAGGRIYEQAGDGTEHEWGRVTVWEPPTRLAYSWHLFFDPADATDITVTFTPDGDSTAVRIEQRGWERLGRHGTERRTNTERAWSTVTPHYVAACQAEPG